MTKTTTFALLPVWAIALAALLMLFALRAQIAQTLPFTSSGHHISAPQLGPGPMNAPAITKTGTTSPNQPAQAGTQQPSSSNQAATNPANNPCARAGNPAPMCPVRAP